MADRQFLPHEKSQGRPAWMTFGKRDLQEYLGLRARMKNLENCISSPFGLAAASQKITELYSRDAEQFGAGVIRIEA